jgi:IS1 family transposase
MSFKEIINNVFGNRGDKKMKEVVEFYKQTQFNI